MQSNAGAHSVLLILACSLLIASAGAFNFVEREDGCWTPYGERGVCTIVPRCGYIMSLIRPRGIASPAVLMFMRRSTCGFIGREPKICCAVQKTTTSTTTTTTTITTTRRPTTTRSRPTRRPRPVFEPDDYDDYDFEDRPLSNGARIKPPTTTTTTSPRTRPSWTTMTTTPRPTTTTTTTPRPKTTTTTTTTTTPRPTTTTTTTTTTPRPTTTTTEPPTTTTVPTTTLNTTPGQDWSIPANVASLLPENCGADLAANRILGGERTELEEFPWMAVLEYEYPKGTITGCGGVLINQRYVLTAAHCVRSIPSTWRLRNVRLGEYDTRTNPDCVNEGNGQLACADRVLIVPIEAEVVHEQFMRPVTYRNDIALLRLSRDIGFTRFVKAICLPTHSQPSPYYWSAGWGQNEESKTSDVKQKVMLPHFDFQRCAELYTTKNLKLGDGQMCAGGKADHDTCKGDSGGPLMKIDQVGNRPGTWVVDGIVSIGFSPCGLTGWPAIYTKVHPYMPWILSKLRP